MQNPMQNPMQTPTCTVANPMQNVRWTCQNEANTIQNGRWTRPHVGNPMQNEGEHVQMLQIPCKMTNLSSKPLRTLGKWYQPRNPKKNPKPVEKKILKLFHTHCQIFLARQLDVRPARVGRSLQESERSAYRCRHWRAEKVLSGTKRARVDWLSRLSPCTAWGGMWTTSYVNLKNKTVLTAA